MTMQPRPRPPSIKGLSLAALGLALAACGGDGPSVPSVDPAQPGAANTEQGGVIGTTATLPNGDTMEVWRGVPYARPPTGVRRLRAPLPPLPRDEILDATEFGDACAQTPQQSPFAIQITNPDIEVSEDCLNLNIYAPAEGGSHPVMVWIHGGGLDTGAAPQSAANPNRLVQQGIVVVTINYRLGILGYLAHPALTDTSITNAAGSGNYGLMDQIRALQWVQSNIANFGGDPGNVTIFGESAGGFSVKGLMAATGRTRGLFRRAIIQSGPVSGQETLDEAENRGGSFMSDLCPDTATRAAADCLRELSLEEIQTAQAEGDFNARIIQRPGVLEQTIPDALASGNFTGEQLMEGTNLDEWRLFIIAEELLTGRKSLEDDSTPYRDELVDRYPFVTQNNVKDVMKTYPLADFATEDAAVSAVGTDFFFVCRALNNVEAEAQHVPTYAYEFADRDAPSLGLPDGEDLPMGAAHAHEIPYILAPASDVASDFSPDSAALAEAMLRHWASFARNGNPNPSDGTLPQWNRFGDQGYQSLQAPPSNNGPVDVGANHNCQFWF